MNKKTLTIIALSALLALSGCSGNDSTPPEEDGTQKNITSQEASENPSAQACPKKKAVHRKTPLLQRLRKTPPPRKTTEGTAYSPIAPQGFRFQTVSLI